MRIVHLFVICALVFAAAYVYRIKMDSTVRTEKVLRLRADIRAQRDAIASLRAEWAKLEAPARLQGLASRHLTLQPIQATQYDSLKNLPPRPPSFVKPGDPDPIGSMIESVDQEALVGNDRDRDTITGSIPSPGGKR
ncbi:cell division protein FtsL [Bradyrhizobium sp. SYSU BS000235]|uniref:cell division protein FtsL n=1 Tax=Bradyrhizobium sp. SYSU BS000235 TaxID=3411332 RepID=UPI003C72539A